MLAFFKALWRQFRLCIRPSDSGEAGDDEVKIFDFDSVTDDELEKKFLEYLEELCREEGI